MGHRTMTLKGMLGSRPFLSWLLRHREAQSNRNVPNFEPKNKPFIIILLLKNNLLFLINLYYQIELSLLFVTVGENQLTLVAMG